MTSLSHAAEAARWQNYVLDHGPELAAFWKTHLAERPRRPLFVLGKSFDPRMLVGLRALLHAGDTGGCDVWAIDFDEGLRSPSRDHMHLVEANWAELQGLLEGRGTVSTRPVPMWSEEGRRVGSRRAADVFAGLADFAGFTDLIIDISALPRGIYFPLVAKALHLLDEASGDRPGPLPNLHVFVTENPGLDKSIQHVGVDETAGYVYPFGEGLERVATAGHPKVWIPILGENRLTHLERIYNLDPPPDEICPVLPFPSLNPRRGDDLVLEYRELLFDRLRIEPRNFIYASERNPFQVYRKIRDAILRYREALAPLGECKAVLSALSSKLLSMGALLVAYELKRNRMAVGVAHVEPQGYVMRDPPPAGVAGPQGELFGLWLSGECYVP